MYTFNCTSFPRPKTLIWNTNQLFLLTMESLLTSMIQWNSFFQWPLSFVHSAHALQIFQHEKTRGPVLFKKKNIESFLSATRLNKKYFVKIQALNCLTAVFNKWRRAKTSRRNLFTIWSVYLVGIVCNITYQHKSTATTACTYPKRTEPGLYWIIRTNFLI